MNRLTMRIAGSLLTVWSVALCGGCAASLPNQPPPLAQMEEPLELFEEPDDEAERRALPLGGFTGAVVGESRDSLEAMLAAADGVEVVRLVENSPAEVAGLQVGDLLLAVSFPDDSENKLSNPSDWRKVELTTEPGTVLTVHFDRASRRSSTELEVVPRVRIPARHALRRVREEKRVGVVLRTATEVEARDAGLGPGGGAVVVGMAKRCPWRGAGIRFGDLIVAVGGEEVSAPEVVLDQISAAGDRMKIAYWRDEQRVEVEAPLTAREQDLREFFIPLLFSYESDRGKSDTSVLLGLFRRESTVAAWRIRLFWFIWFSGGDADKLLEVDS